MMYTVHMEQECGCFKESEYESTKTFDFQREAYNYAHTVAEFMNEDFCGKHLFAAQKLENDDFLITVVNNPNAGGCSTGSCGPDDSAGSCDTGSCGC